MFNILHLFLLLITVLFILLINFKNLLKIFRTSLLLKDQKINLKSLVLNEENFVYI